MRKMVMSFIAAFGLIAVGLIILLVYGLLHDGVNFTFGSLSMELVKTESISLDDIDTIDIEYTSANIEFYTSDTTELIFKEFMSYEPEDEELSRIETNGNTLMIQKGHYRTSSIFWQKPRNHRIEIYLPDEYSGKLTVETSSGNIHAEPVLRLSQFSVKCSSGNIKVHEVYAEEITASTSSGNINFDVAQGHREFSANSGNIKVEGGSGDSIFDTSSGNISVEKASGYLEASASSGGVRIQNSSGGGRFDTTSGNISLEFTSVTQDLKATASSGNINLTIPESASFQFSANTSSGNIHTFFDNALDYNKKGNSAHGTVGESPEVSIELKASSGNIRVKD